MLRDLLKNYRVILASQSPRREMLLTGIDIEFEIVVRPGVDEEFPAGMDLLEIPQYLAEHKSEYYTDLLDGHTLLITADTIVWHKGHFVGKPKDAEEAREILSGLSGSMHEVVTGVCIRSTDRKRVFYSHSRVFFRKLTSEEIQYYIERYQPLDKAGAYGIQEWIGYVGIEKIEGSFYNVMGLPIQLLYAELEKFLTQNQ
ncbi:MAG: septum formation protein Maf [Bacteroidales bacterium]|nr:septum formation protein Maf [Bacteroidales bacterium]